MDTSRVDRVIEAIERDLPQPWIEQPGGWPDEVEAALIDAVLSIRARYGTNETGVRAAVRRYRRAQSEGAGLNSLNRLAVYSPGEVEELLGVRQRTSGVSKAEAIVNAAQALVAVGVHRAADVDPVAHRSAYTGVHGLGWITWEYFTMLLGKPGVKADTWITSWVSTKIGEGVSSKEAHATLIAAGERLQVESLTQLDHVIWNDARRRR